MWTLRVSSNFKRRKPHKGIIILIIIIIILIIITIYSITFITGHEHYPQLRAHTRQRFQNELSKSVDIEMNNGRSMGAMEVPAWRRLINLSRMNPDLKWLTCANFEQSITSAEAVGGCSRRWTKPLWLCNVEPNAMRLITDKVGIKFKNK